MTKPRVCCNKARKDKRGSLAHTYSFKLRAMGELRVISIRCDHKEWVRLRKNGSKRARDAYIKEHSKTGILLLPLPLKARMDPQEIMKRMAFIRKARKMIAAEGAYQAQNKERMVKRMKQHGAPKGEIAKVEALFLESEALSAQLRKAMGE